MKNRQPFHAFWYVTDIEASVAFYRDVVGCPIQFSNPTAFSIDFFGHGISFEYVDHFPGLSTLQTCSAQDVDNRQYVPSMHWGINLESQDDFEQILNRAKQHKVEFIVPATRYNVGATNEQALFFIKDPTGYVLEFRFMSKRFKLEELGQWDQRSEGHERTAILK